MTAFFATAAMAQDQQKDMKKEKTEWEKKVKDELNLTTEQAEKYDALCKEYDEKFTAVAQDASLTKDEQKEKKLALKKEKNDKFNEFLTPEQQAKYKEMVDKKMKEKGMAPKQY
jgi:Spy/CpxP family protein refolding chaperone